MKFIKVTKYGVGMFALFVATSVVSAYIVISFAYTIDHDHTDDILTALTWIGVIDFIVAVGFVLMINMFLFTYSTYDAIEENKRLKKSLAKADAAVKENTISAFQEYYAEKYHSNRFVNKRILIVEDSFLANWYNSAIITTGTYTLYSEQFFDGVTTRDSAGNYYHFESMNLHTYDGTLVVYKSHLVEPDYKK